jgi:predicted short-subunit dehydrogenase-like oxidoreductase (DUF2520 family)
MKDKLMAAKPAAKLTIAIVGTGRLACFLAVALRDAGFTITEIVARDLPASRREARALAVKVGARGVTITAAALDAALLWLCVPDGAIRDMASNLAVHLASGANANKKYRFQKKWQKRIHNRVRFAFHSSGALSSRELGPLRKAGIAVASVHPLMTFVGGTHPDLAGVPFAIEGDAPATRVARQIVRNLAGESFSLPASRKAAYHAWATLTSPLFLAFLITLEEAARAAGFTRQDARRKSLPILRQTLANYSHLGPDRSFSGPLIRGDAQTVAKHLAVLEKHPGALEVYRTLARAALRGLSVKNRSELDRLLRTH